MQTLSIHPAIRKAINSLYANETITPDAKDRLFRLEMYDKLRAGGCSATLAFEAIEWSKATYYRWRKRYLEQGIRGLATGDRRPLRCRQPQWTRQQEQLVLRLRKDHPFWGKLKLWKLLTRDWNVSLSVSTVGRILTKAMGLGRIRPCAFYQGRIKPKRPRDFSEAYAQRWVYGTRAGQPGEFVQMDHMSASVLAGTQIKEFRAVCPFSKYTVVRAYHRATAFSARNFLRDALEDFPFPVRSIQVDGGSEFMGEFEEECAKLGIGLYVLPPRRPQYNGNVERANATSRLEFHSMYNGEHTVKAVNEGLRGYQHSYNHYRPHQALGLMTPVEYLNSLLETA